MCGSSETKVHVCGRCYYSEPNLLSKVTLEGQNSEHHYPNPTLSPVDWSQVTNSGVFLGPGRRRLFVVTIEDTGFLQ